ncbi:MAG: DUF2442 domain-containing protein [Anaerolineae bacterium]|nr:DUF2442 domain-containing protein [Anaerolineae bacterium]
MANERTEKYPDQPVSATVRDEKVWIELADGRVLASPVDWYPFLVLATPEQLSNIELLPFSVVWADLDDGISIDSILDGRKPPHTVEEYVERKQALQEALEEQEKESQRLGE